jgi:hypothetical protein
VSVLALAFGLIVGIFVVGVIAAAWIIRAVLFRKARANGWVPPAPRPGLHGSYGPDGRFYVDAPGDQAGHRGGWGGFGGGHGGWSGGGHHGGGGGGGGGDTGGGGHHH